MKNKFKIFIFIKDADFTDFLKFYLRKEGFHVKFAKELKSVANIDSDVDLIIIDSTVTAQNGMDYCLKIRKSKFKEKPMLLILENAMRIPQEKLLCKTVNVLFKPLSANDLILKVKYFLRQNNKINNDYFKEIIEVGPLKLDPNNFSLLIDGQQTQLPKKEFQILALLLNNPNKVFSRHEILDSIWGEKVIVINRTVDVHVRKIREKLGRYSSIIETVKGIGYKYSPV